GLAYANAFGVGSCPGGHQYRIGHHLKSLIGKVMLRVPDRIPAFVVKVLRQINLLAHDRAIGFVLAVNSVGKVSEFHLVWLLLIRVQSSWHTPISLTACRLQLE